MKNLAYALFVASVLFISAFARAEVAPRIHDVLVDASGTRLMVAGYIPNPCFSEPIAHLTADEQNPAVLILRLTTTRSPHNCFERIQPFTTSIDLRTLVGASRLELDPGSVYLIKTKGHEFQLELAGVQLL